MKDSLEGALAKTSWEFLDDIDQSLANSQEVLGKLRTTVDELFSNDPTSGEMEDSVTGFSGLRKELEECRMRVQRFRDAKPTPPGKERWARSAKRRRKKGNRPKELKARRQ